MASENENVIPGLQVVTGQILIQQGFNADGLASIFCQFYDVSQGEDADGNSVSLNYFDGKKMLAVAEDQFLMQCGLMHAHPGDLP